MQFYIDMSGNFSDLSGGLGKLKAIKVEDISVFDGSRKFLLLLEKILA